MRVPRPNTSPSSPLIRNTRLQRVASHNYLGVHVTSNVSWNTHTYYVIATAYSVLGYLKQNFTSVPMSLKLVLHKTVVRPRLENAASIWEPGHRTLVTNLEASQNFDARLIPCDYHRTATISFIKTTLSPLLSLRRKISPLCLFHKFY